MQKDSIFTEEWRRCLRAHYMDVVRRDDQVTLKTLVRVMHDTGFSDDELAELRVQATMRADEMPDDFVPDTRIFQVNADLSAQEEIAPASEPESFYEPANFEEDAQDERLAPMNEIADAVQQDIPEEPEQIEAEEEDPDAPQQLTLF
jgi:hypothetical protein